MSDSSPEYELDESYASLRALALGLAPADVGLPRATGTDVLAVLMETGYAEAAVTLVAVADGTTSLYFSSGGGVIGAGEAPEVSAAAEALVARAAEFVAGAAMDAQAPLPTPGHVRFTFVTPAGPYTAQATEEDLGERRHPFAELFYQAHAVIAALRENAEG